MRDINAIVIHCSATYPDMDIGLAEIEQWHKDRGFNSVGYHYIIRRNGEVEKGRPDAHMGAHVAGHNKNTIGGCMVGGLARDGRQACNFTREQWETLDCLVDELQAYYPQAEIKGHNDYTDSKTCPTFDVVAWAGGR